MAEHWSMFFEQAPAKESDGGRITVASSTDTQASVNGAASHNRWEETETPDVVYTEVRRAPIEADGGTEHNEPRVLVNGKRMSTTKPGPDIDIPMPENPGYLAQINAAKQVLPDFDQVMDETPIPVAAAEAIRSAPNGALVGYYLAKHRGELESLFGLSDGQVRRRIVDLSQRLSLNPIGADPGTLPYRAYRRLRDGK